MTIKELWIYNIGVLKGKFSKKWAKIAVFGK